MRRGGRGTWSQVEESTVVGGIGGLVLLYFYVALYILLYSYGGVSRLEGARTFISNRSAVDFGNRDCGLLPTYSSFGLASERCASVCVARGSIPLLLVSRLNGKNCVASSKVCVASRFTAGCTHASMCGSITSHVRDNSCFSNCTFRCSTCCFSRRAGRSR